MEATEILFLPDKVGVHQGSTKKSYVSFYNEKTVERLGWIESIPKDVKVKYFLVMSMLIKPSRKLE